MLPVVTNAPGLASVKTNVISQYPDTGGTIVANCTVPVRNVSFVVGVIEAADAIVGHVGCLSFWTVEKF
jgi:hypothetical protein